MDLRALCLQIFTAVMLSTKHVLSYTIQIPAFPIITPDRLQFFEYESVFLNCGGGAGMDVWRVMRKLKKMSPTNVPKECSIPAPSCTIDTSFEKHSGEYWCENDDGLRSRSLSIAVTAGEVILNISVQPVREGSDVALHCIAKNAEKTRISDFYKDGIYIKTYYKSVMNLSNVSKADEGLYKCSIFSEGESPESWLAVVKPSEEVLQSTQHPLHNTIQIPAFPVITPDRLQFFEYESVCVNCGGDKDMDAWRVMRKLKSISANESEDCSITAPSCTFDLISEIHSGEYWCENDWGIKSHSLKIAVTAGPVILNIPAQPVKEGSEITLHCITKNGERTHISDFYKNGKYLETFYESGMSISKVSKADEGLYKCSISSAGESPESWLAVIKPIEEGSFFLTEETQYLTPVMNLLLRTLVFLFLLIGLIFLMRCKVLGGNPANQPDQDTYASAENKMTGQKVHSAPLGQYSSKREPMCSEEC